VVLLKRIPSPASQVSLPNASPSKGGIALTSWRVGETTRNSCS